MATGSTFSHVPTNLARDAGISIGFAVSSPLASGPGPGFWEQPIRTIDAPTAAKLEIKAFL